jgi:hypothetical protein
MSLMKFKLHFIYDDRLYMYKHIIDLEKKFFFVKSEYLVYRSCRFSPEENHFDRNVTHTFFPENVPQ